MTSPNTTAIVYHTKKAPNPPFCMYSAPLKFTLGSFRDLYLGDTCNYEYVFLPSTLIREPISSKSKYIVKVPVRTACAEFLNRSFYPNPSFITHIYPVGPSLRLLQITPALQDIILFYTLRVE